MQRLSRLSAAARELAPAAAVLGEADLRLAAGLAGVDPRAAATAADELAAAGILQQGRPLRFIHPIVRAAVEADLPPGERAGLHAAAARRLADEGAPAHRIAAHLLATDPAGDDWVTGSLLPAARAAIATGALDSAVAYLRRALAEPPPGRLRSDVLLELGFAESYAGDPQAAAHLEAALDTAAGAAAQVSITLALGRMLQIDGRNREALEVFDRTRARLGGTDRRAALTLEGAALGAAQFDAQTADDAAGRIARLRRVAEQEPDVPPSVFGVLAVAAVNANEPADTVARLALRALDGAPKLLPETVDRPPFFYHACNALVCAERYADALSRFSEALADARRLGSLPHVLALSCYRALLHLRIGNLADAEADARAALETGPRPPGIHAAPALAALLESLSLRLAVRRSSRPAVTWRRISSGVPSGAVSISEVIDVGAWARLVVALQNEQAVTLLAASIWAASPARSPGINPGNRSVRLAEIWRRYPPWLSPIRCSTVICRQRSKSSPAVPAPQSWHTPPERS